MRMLILLPIGASATVIRCEHQMAFHASSISATFAMPVGVSRRISVLEMTQLQIRATCLFTLHTCRMASPWRLRVELKVAFPPP